jgi:serine/threonine protein kinase
MQLKCSSCGNDYAADQAGGLCPRCLAAMAGRMSDTPVDEVPIEPGETFHGLLVQKLVARGGMGVIYRARKAGATRDVALKILPRSLATEEEFRLRFDREARALAGLNHANIVNLLDYGVEGDLMFLVMEFVEGVSLRHILREKRITQDRAVKIALDLCEALEFAHKEGIVHRDVKPENILIDPSGRVKLTDFGLAKRVDPESTQLTQTHFAVGTPHYMAPEQLEQPKEIDHRVDIYSLGVVLYEMLTRELPIGRFPAPSSKEEVDERFDDIVYRCLDKDPARRYPNIAQLKSAIRSATGKSYEAPVEMAEDRPTPARPKIASNISITCPCGWEFFVPTAARGTVHCPSCGDPIRLSQPTPVQRPPTTRKVPIVQEKPRVPRSLLIAGGVLGLLVVVLLVLVLAFRSTPPSGEISYQPPPSKGPDKAPPPPPVSILLDPEPTKATGPSKSPTAPSSSADPTEVRRQIDRLVAQCNMAGLTSTILLYSGRPLDYENLQEYITKLDNAVKDRLLQLEVMGQKADSPERYRTGDRVAGFGTRRLETAKTIAFSDDLRTWLRAFRPGISETLTVSRNRQPMAFIVQFPERTPELVALAAQVGVNLGDDPTATAPPSTEAKGPLPAATVSDLRKRFDALHPFYRSAIPYEDRAKGEALLGSGQGTNDDAMFLAGRFAEMIRRCESEHHSFGAKVKELEVRIADSGASIDTVACKDGRRLEGTIVEETPEQIKIKSKFGTIPLKREEILRIEKNKGSAQEFRTAYETGRTQKNELLRLLALAKEKKMQLQTELAAAAVLAIDPADERCRLELGLPRTPFAVVDAGQDHGDRIEFRGRTYTADQLRAELRSLGYVQINGLWCEKVQKSFKIDNLYKDQSQLAATYTGTMVQSHNKTETTQAYDPDRKAFIEKKKEVSLARYIGGSGSCLIEISSPGEVVDCRVRARSKVDVLGGYVAVSVAVDPRDNGKLLYTLAAPGNSDVSYDVTDKVAGAVRFYIRADLRMGGMFLYSDSNDLSVLEVKWSYGRPLDKINSLFATSLPPEAPGEVRPAIDPVENACRGFASQLIQMTTMPEALLEMRRSTEGLVYRIDYTMPARYAEIATILRDPLSPNIGMTREQSNKLAAWWGQQNGDERREFLTSYGVWCARTRHLRGSR